MNWSPLGRFDPSAAIDAKIIAAARASVAKLPSLPQRLLWRLYLHWAVAPFGCTFGDYNAMANYVGGEWVLQETHDPRDNAPGFNTNAEAAHTYMRNTGAVGIALAGMDGASTSNFGPDGITIAGLDYLCAGAAALATKYEIDALGTSIQAPYADEPTILTHAEAGDRVGNPPQYAAYGPKATFERWDLLTFIPIPPGVKFTDSSICGNALRTRIHAMKQQIA